MFEWKNKKKKKKRKGTLFFERQCDSSLDFSVVLGKKLCDFSFSSTPMTSKATQEYRHSFITLISQLSEIEQKSQEFFDKM